MGTTPRGIPYPDPTDYVVDGPAAIQALAEQVDAELAAASAAYVAKGAPITLGAPALTVVMGAANLVSAMTWTPVWLLDAALAEAVGGQAQLPSDWATFAVDVWWVNIGTGSGAARLRLVYGGTTPGTADGESIASATAVGYIDATAAAQNIVKVTTLASGLNAARPFQTVVVQRDGAHANDTLPGDIGVMALVLRKVS